MKELIKYTEDLLEYVEQGNKYSPFPQYDTEYVELIKSNLEKMYNKKYDEGPVSACKFCNELSIIDDDLDNGVCTKCGAVNDIIIYQDIFEFLETKHGDN